MLGVQLYLSIIHQLIIKVSEYHDVFNNVVIDFLASGLYEVK